MKQLLIKLLFRLIDKQDYSNIRDKQINNWLSEQHQTMGFHEYFRKRDLTLLKTIGLGLDREKYLLYLGRRLELLQLLSQTKQAFENKKRSEKKKKK